MKNSYVKIFIKQILPWIIAIGILIFLFWRIDRQQFVDSLLKVDLIIYLPLIIFFIILWFLLESQNIMKLFQGFGYDVSYDEIVKIRGATFLLMIINYGLGAGGIALYMKKFRDIPLLRSTSLLFFYMVTESAGIAFLAIVGSLLITERSIMLDRVFLICTGLFIAYNIEIIVLKFLPGKGILKKLKENALVSSFSEATFKTYSTIFFLRCIYFLSFILFFYFAVKAFHMQIPLLILVALVPIIFFIGNLPITPFGLGSIQAAMLYFFKDYSSEANILALSIIYSTSLLLFRAIIGLFYLRKVTSLKSKEIKNLNEAVL